MPMYTAQALNIVWTLKFKLRLAWDNPGPNMVNSLWGLSIKELRTPTGRSKAVQVNGKKYAISWYGLLNESYDELTLESMLVGMAAVDGVKPPGLNDWLREYDVENAEINLETILQVGVYMFKRPHDIRKADLAKVEKVLMKISKSADTQTVQQSAKPLRELRAYVDEHFGVLDENLESLNNKIDRIIKLLLSNTSRKASLKPESRSQGTSQNSVQPLQSAASLKLLAPQIQQKDPDPKEVHQVIDAPGAPRQPQEENSQTIPGLKKSVPRSSQVSIPGRPRLTSRKASPLKPESRGVGTSKSSLQPLQSAASSQVAAHKISVLNKRKSDSGSPKNAQSSQPASKKNRSSRQPSPSAANVKVTAPQIKQKVSDPKEVDQAIDTPGAPHQLQEEQETEPTTSSKPKRRKPINAKQMAGVEPITDELTLSKLAHCDLDELCVGAKVVLKRRSQHHVATVFEIAAGGSISLQFGSGVETVCTADDVLLDDRRLWDN